MTTIPTIKTAKAAHPLASAVLAQLGGGTEAVQSAIDAGEHGADAGWAGFTYYKDTVAFAKRHRREILRMAREMAEDLGEVRGEPGAVSLIAGFRCIKDSGVSVRDIEATLMEGADDDAADLVWNALAWFALEEVGRAIANAQDGAE